MIHFLQAKALFWSEPSSFAEGLISDINPEKNGTIVMVVTNNNGGGNTDARFAIMQRSIIPDISKIFDRASVVGYINTRVHQSKTIIENNYGKMIVGALFGCYVWILYQIRKTNMLIKQHDAWCNWKAIVSLLQMQCNAQQELFMQLKLDICKKYGPSSYANNSTHCIDLFVYDIKQELAVFDAYLDWYNFVQKTMISRFFNFSFDVVAIEEKKARLYFLLDLLMIHQAQNI